MNQMKKYLETNELLSPTQHAYRPHRSCATAWCEMDTWIQKSRDQGLHTSLVSTDNSAAFNVITSQLLVRKMELLGFTVQARAFVKSYMTGRQVTCHVGTATSSAIKIEVGVGEGSCSGPDFWNVAIIDVSAVPTCAMVKVERENMENVKMSSQTFADDCTGEVAAKTEDDLEKASNILMSEYKDYFTSAGLKINESKCCLLVMRRSAKTRDLVFANGDLEVKQMKLLGLKVESGYVFDKHVDSVIQRCNYRLSNIARVAHHMPQHVLKRTVEALVLSIMRYGLEVYCKNLTQISKLQKCLNSALRLVTNGDRYTSIESMLRKTVWNNVPNMIREQKVSMLIKTIRTRVCMRSFELLERIKTNTRSSPETLSWHHKTSFGDKSFLVSSWKIFKNIGLTAHSFDDTNNQKVRLKFMLWQHYGNENI